MVKILKEKNSKNISSANGYKPINEKMRPSRKKFVETKRIWESFNFDNSKDNSNK